MKKTLIVSLCFALILGTLGFTGCQESTTKDFAVETLAMAIGYEVRNDFEWTASVDNYYNAIMEGKMSLDAAQAAENYLRTKTHPLIANRLVRLANMVGFNMNEVGNLTGVDKVDIHLLQIAAQGFRQGVLLDKVVSNNSIWPNYSGYPYTYNFEIYPQDAVVVTNLLDKDLVFYFYDK